MKLKVRLEKLELKCAGHGGDCLVFARNMFGMGSEEKQVESWRARNPGIDPKIIRIEIVGFAEALK